jgi:catechol 2,3-dioxygenase
VGLADFEAERKRLEAAGLAVKAEHAWVRWRSLYVNDPEGNTVELVCSHPSMR